MRLYCTLIFILIPIIFLGQAQPKKEYVLDEKGNTIPVPEFKSKMMSEDYIYKISEDDISITAQLVLRKEKGLISQEKRLKILRELNAITGTVIDHNNTIVINFYFNEDLKSSCVDHYSADGSYKAFFRRKEQFSQFFITQKDFKYKGDNVYEDNGNIEKLLFPEFFGCGNYIIIQPDGKYLKHNSEYIQKDIPAILKKGL